MYSYPLPVCLAYRVQKRKWDPMKLERQAVVTGQLGKECGYKSAVASPFIDF